MDSRADTDFENLVTLLYIKMTVDRCYFVEVVPVIAFPVPVKSLCKTFIGFLLLFMKRFLAALFFLYYYVLFCHISLLDQINLIKCHPGIWQEDFNHQGVTGLNRTEIFLTRPANRRILIV